MRRCSADDRAFSAWLICLMPSGPVALTFTAWLRAWITASSVDRSNSMAPLTAFTRLGIRSWRRLSWTSICLNAFSVWFLREMSPLYAPTSHATTTTRTTSKMSGPMVTPFRGDATLRVCRWQEFRERLPHRLGDRGVLGAQPREGMGRLDVQLYPPADGDAVPGARALGVARGAALQHVPGLILHLFDDRRQRRPLHLPQLDPQKLEEMPVGICGRGTASFGRAHQPLGDVEPDRALAGLRPCGRIDRSDRGGIEDGPHERGEIAQVPRGEVAILPQRV